MQSPSKILEVDHLSNQYEGQPLLQDISFSLWKVKFSASLAHQALARPRCSACSRDLKKKRLGQSCSAVRTSETSRLTSEISA